MQPVQRAMAQSYIVNKWPNIMFPENGPETLCGQNKMVIKALTDTVYTTLESNGNT